MKFPAPIYGATCEMNSKIAPAETPAARDEKRSSDISEQELSNHEKNLSKRGLFERSEFRSERSFFMV